MGIFHAFDIDLKSGPVVYLIESFLVIAGHFLNLNESFFPERTPNVASIYPYF